MKITQSHDEPQQLPCAEKLSYPTKEAAAAAGSYAVWQYGPASANLRPYRCRYCVSWHLGSDYGRDDDLVS